MIKRKREKKGRFYVCQRSGCSFSLHSIPTKYRYTKEWILDFPLYQWQQCCSAISNRFIHSFSFKRGSREESTPPSILQECKKLCILIHQRLFDNWAILFAKISEIGFLAVLWRNAYSVMYYLLLSWIIFLSYVTNINIKVINNTNTNNPSAYQIFDFLDFVCRTKVFPSNRVSILVTIIIFINFLSGSKEQPT